MTVSHNCSKLNVGLVELVRCGIYELVCLDELFNSWAMEWASKHLTYTCLFQECADLRFLLDASTHRKLVQV
jgi:hypothetical protein